MNVETIRRIAYWIWRGLPPYFDLDDIQSEAVLASLQAPSGCEVIAARRAIYNYLRREQPGSRGTGKLCLNTIWWMVPRERTPEQQAIHAERVEMLKAAVDLLTVKELRVINSIYRREMKQLDVAKQMGTTEAYVSRLKRSALTKLQEACA